MYTGNFTQGPMNSCGAATLVIAANQLGLTQVTEDKVREVYDQTKDEELSKSLRYNDPNQYLSIPEKVLSAADRLGLSAKLYITEDVNLAGFSIEIQGFKKKYIDSINPDTINNQTLLGLLTDKSYLQLLVYIKEDPLATHWLLMQKENEQYYIYDTAYGKNYEASAEMLKFRAPIATGGRPNNFFGIAILLTGK